jgi:IS30 family transposase
MLGELGIPEPPVSSGNQRNTWPDWRTLSSIRPGATRRFSDEEKQQIWDWHQDGVPVNRIARRLGRNNASLRKLVGETGGVRPRARTVNDRHLSLAEREEISRGLAAGLSLRKAKWSPEEISGWLARTYPNDPEMQVSHETIYQSIFVQGRGALRHELHVCLRSGRAMRRNMKWAKRGHGMGKIRDMVMITERPDGECIPARPSNPISQLLVASLENGGCP